MLETVSQICKHHHIYFQRLPYKDGNRVVDATSDALDHKATLFKSLNLQVMSQEKRMQNLTNLVQFFPPANTSLPGTYKVNQAFNLVTQSNNMLAINDGRAMKTIATITLVFLPFATVAVSIEHHHQTIDE